MEVEDFISAVRDTRKKIGRFGLRKKYAEGLTDLAETLLMAESQRRTVAVKLFKGVREAIEGLRDLPVKGKKAERRRDSFLHAAEKYLDQWEGKPLPVEEKKDGRDQRTYDRIPGGGGDNSGLAGRKGPYGIIRGGLDGIRPRDRQDT